MPRRNTRHWYVPHIDIQGMQLYYEDSGGDGPPIVLMHGANSAIDDPRASWAGLVGLLGTGYRTLSVDNRGHGRSNNPQSLFDYATLANDIADFAVALGLPPFHFAGISDGAIAGLHLSMYRPELLRSTVLLGANFENDEQTLSMVATWKSFAELPDDSPRHELGPLDTIEPARNPVTGEAS